MLSVLKLAEGVSLNSKFGIGKSKIIQETENYDKQVQALNEGFPGSCVLGHTV